MVTRETVRWEPLQEKWPGMPFLCKGSSAVTGYRKTRSVAFPDSSRSSDGIRASHKEAGCNCKERDCSKSRMWMDGSQHRDL